MRILSKIKMKIRKKARNMLGLFELDVDHTGIKPQDSIKWLQCSSWGDCCALFKERESRRVSPASELSGQTCFVWREERELVRVMGLYLVMSYWRYSGFSAGSSPPLLPLLPQFSFRFVLTFLISTTSSSVLRNHFDLEQATSEIERAIS